MTSPIRRNPYRSARPPEPTTPPPRVAGRRVLSPSRGNALLTPETKSAEKERIRQHAFQRVCNEALQALALVGYQGELRLGRAAMQVGKANSADNHGAHRIMTSGIYDKATGCPITKNTRVGILVNGVDSLPRGVNLITDKKLENALRPTLVVLLNRVADGTLSPQAYTEKVIKLVRDHFKQTKENLGWKHAQLQELAEDFETLRKGQQAALTPMLEKAKVGKTVRARQHLRALRAKNPQQHLVSERFVDIAMTQLREEVESTKRRLEWAQLQYEGTPEEAPAEMFEVFTPSKRLRRAMTDQEMAEHARYLRGAATPFKKLKSDPN